MCEQVFVNFHFVQFFFCLKKAIFLFHSLLLLRLFISNYPRSQKKMLIFRNYFYSFLSMFRKNDYQYYEIFNDRLFFFLLVRRLCLCAFRWDGQTRSERQRKMEYIFALLFYWQAVNLFGCRFAFLMVSKSSTGTGQIKIDEIWMEKSISRTFQFDQMNGKNP